MATILNILVCIACGAMILLLACSLFYFKLGWFKFFYHDVLKWHVPIYGVRMSDSKIESICKHCGKEIMQDSQGNWF